jgi:hypothetical protein
LFSGVVLFRARRKLLAEGEKLANLPSGSALLRLQLLPQLFTAPAAALYVFPGIQRSSLQRQRWLPKGRFVRFGRLQNVRDQSGR